MGVGGTALGITGGIYGGLFGAEPDDRGAGAYGKDPGYQDAQNKYLGEEKLKAYGQADQAGQGQGQVAQQYMDAAAGKGPSAAEMQMRQGAQQAQQNALSVAANSTGHNALLAQQQAQQANQQTAMQTNQQAGQLRAQEIATARAGAAGLFGQMRSQAQQQGQFQETTAQGMNQAQLGADTSMAAANLKKDSDYQHDRATGIGGLVSGAGGALLGMCCSPHTLIDTPAGERRIDQLKTGDPVWSEREGRRVESTVAIVSQRSWERGTHQVVRVHLESGRVLEISGNHPTADGRTFNDLRAGDELGSQIVRAVAVIPYKVEYTHDIRPDTPSGCYWAEGALIGSTIPGGS